jgi:hypothetical protein
VPASFETTHKRALREQAQQREMDSRAREAQRELDAYEQRERYEGFLIAETDAHMKNKMAQSAIDHRVLDHMTRIQQGAPQYRWPEPTLRRFAMRKLREEVAAELDLPSFEEFTHRKAETLF